MGEDEPLVHKEFMDVPVGDLVGKASEGEAENVPRPSPPPSPPPPPPLVEDLLGLGEKEE